ncbi:hypothetical protein Q9L58_002340 [Maublancomyces gigas]|uniref:Phosphoglycerate mutase-like protein n=1 Tax=Discina gigas TaxID=1032678 RepID=A0ABR3GRR6_9PEZI
MPHVRAREYVVPDQDVYELEYVEVIQRHHKRSPYQKNTFPAEDHEWPGCGDTREFYYGQPTPGFDAAKIYWDNYQDPLNPLQKPGYQGSCQFPQITKDGLQDSYTHGKDLYEVYGKKLNFLPRFFGETTIFRVTSNVITSQVAGGLIKGMFGTSAEVPVLQQYDSIDSLRPGYSCGYADNIRGAYQGNNLNWTEHLEQSQQLFITDPKNCVSSDDADKVFRLAQFEYSYIFRDAPQSLEYARTKYGLYLNELAARLRQHIQGIMPGAEVKYRHNIAHDGSMAPLLGALQVSEMVWPGMGSEVVFELYSSSRGEKKWFVRVLWGGKVMHSSAMGEINMIPADELLGYITGLVGENASYVLGKCGY